MSYRAARSPLAWLGGLLALYLTVPLIAFAVRFAGSSDRGLHEPGLWTATATSVLSATIATAIIAVLGVPLASWLARSAGRGAAVIGVAVQLPLALPPVMSGIVLIYVVGPYSTIGGWLGGRLTDSLAGVVIAQTFVAAPFLIVAARSAFASVDPTLDEVAATLGQPPLARFFRVHLPVAAAGIRAGLLLTWLRAIGEYGATVLLAYHPYSLPVFTYVQFSTAGIPATQAPTALALALAVLGLVLARLRRPQRLRRRTSPPAPRPPRPGPATPVAFDLDHAAGSFRLRLDHRATSHRLAILGPSGAGKSMTLRALAGLLPAGAVRFAGRPVPAVAWRRRVGWVPQSAALFPGRTVWQQLTFAPDADPALAAWWLRTLRLDDLTDRRPEELSGGQQHRVSLARALAREPALLLLDEPFSALDAPVRDELRRELRRLQHEVGLSTVLVTHDPEEAALLAEEILVIADGRLLQHGSRSEVYRRPATPTVAALLGIRNVAAGTAIGPDTVAVGPDTVLRTEPHGLAEGTAVQWTVRPEQIAIRPAHRDPAPTDWHAAVVRDVVDLGATAELTVELGPARLAVRVADPAALRSGAACWIGVEPTAITIWPHQPAP